MSCGYGNLHLHLSVHCDAYPRNRQHLEYLNQARKVASHRPPSLLCTDSASDRNKNHLFGLLIQSRLLLAKCGSDDYVASIQTDGRSYTVLDDARAYNEAVSEHFLRQKGG